MTPMPHLRLCITALLLAGIVLFSCSGLPGLSDPQGTAYRTVIIGGQTWMAENLRFDVGDGSYCYDDDPVKCNEMGRLYTWQAALRAAEEIDGWHLPSKQEWQELVDFCGEDSAAAYFSLISDTIGFNPEWSGVRVSTGVFKAAGLKSANYWSSSLSDTSSTLAYSVAVMSGFQMISPHNYPIANACSVRLIRDR